MQETLVDLTGRLRARAWTRVRIYACEVCATIYLYYPHHLNITLPWLRSPCSIHTPTYSI